MIIECKNCLKKFKVKDSDIPEIGRQVQCGNCSTQWLQLPISSPITTADTNIKISSSLNEIIASDGKSYKYLGSQWAEALPSGKTGKLAKKKISKELSKFTGINKEKAVKKKIKDEINNEDKLSTQTDKVGMGIFSMLFVFILFIGSIILLLDTFKFWLIPVWPELEDYLVYTFETINNIYILSKDLFFTSYK